MNRNNNTVEDHVTLTSIPNDLAPMTVNVLKAYVNKFVAMFPVAGYVGPEDEKVLNAYTLADIYFVIEAKEIQAQSVRSTPFALGNRCIEKGYDVKPTVDIAGNGEVVVTSGDTVVNLPVKGGKVATTNLRVLGFDVIPFDPALHRIATIISTFFEARGGKFVGVTISEQVLELTLMKNVIPKLDELRLAIGDFLRQVAAGETVIKNVSGIDATDYFYELVQKYRNHLSPIYRVLSTGVRCQGNQPYVKTVDKKITFASPSVLLPSRIAGEVCSLDNCKYEQALYALEILKGFRGSDQRERGGIPRMAYSLFEFSSIYSEVSYWCADLTRIGVLDYKMLHLVCSHNVVTVKEILMALEILKYEGRVQLIGMDPKHVGRVEKDKIYSAGGKILLSAGSEYNLFNEKDGMILDTRVIAKPGGKLLAAIEEQNRMVLHRLKEYEACNLRVVVTVPLGPAAATWCCYPSIRAHNLVGFAEKGDGTSTGAMMRIWYTSIVVNIIRSFRAIHIMPLPTVISKLSFGKDKEKLSVQAAPTIEWCGKVGAKAFFAYDIDAILEYYDNDTEVPKEEKVAPSTEAEFEDVQYDDEEAS